MQTDPPKRFCERRGCVNEITRKPKEGSMAFGNRRYCSVKCSTAVIKRRPI